MIVINQEATVETTTERNPQRQRFHIPIWLGLCLFLAIAAFFLLEEHRAHILGAVPYLLLLSCPFVHMFMHRGHGRHGGDFGHGDHQQH